MARRERRAEPDVAGAWRQLDRRRSVPGCRLAASAIRPSRCRRWTARRTWATLVSISRTGSTAGIAAAGVRQHRLARRVARSNVGGVRIAVKRGNHAEVRRRATARAADQLVGLLPRGQPRPCCSRSRRRRHGHAAPRALCRSTSPCVTSASSRLPTGNAKGTPASAARRRTARNVAIAAPAPAAARPRQRGREVADQRDDTPPPALSTPPTQLGDRDAGRLDPCGSGFEDGDAYRVRRSAARR